MRFALCLRQGYSIGDLTAIESGSLQGMIQEAEDRHLLTTQGHPDGKLYGAKWERNYDGRPVPYAILPLGCLPADKRGGR